MIPDSCLRCSTNPSWLHSGSENMDHRERHQIGGASNEKRNHVASGPLQDIAHDSVFHCWHRLFGGARGDPYSHSQNGASWDSLSSASMNLESLDGIRDNVADYKFSLNRRLR